MTKRLLLILMLTGVLSSVAPLFTCGEHEDESTPGTTLSKEAQEILSKAKRPSNMKPEEWKRVTKIYEMIVGKNDDIGFFGKVVDENKRGIPGVEVKGFVRSYDKNWINDIANSARTNGQKKEQWHVTSDPKGLFEITGMRGVSLHIDSFFKEGYVAPKPTDFFRFSQKEFRNRVHKGKSTDPVIFRMWQQRDAQSRAMLTKRRFRVYGLSDGSENRIDLLAGKAIISTKKAFDLSVVVSSDLPTMTEDRRYDWSASVSVFNGGIVETSEEHPFKAPQSGYKPKISFRMMASDADWSRKIEKGFYVRSRDGQVYAAVDIIIYAYRGRRVLVKVTSVANTGGSNDLMPL